MHISMTPEEQMVKSFQALDPKRNTKASQMSYKERNAGVLLLIALKLEGRIATRVNES